MKQKTKAFKRMKTAGKIIVLFLLVLLLSGCTADSSLLEEKKDLVVSCFNHHALDELQSIVYPNGFTKEELEAGYQGIAESWQQIDAKDVKMIRFSTQTYIAQDHRVTTYQGIFRFPEAMDQYALYLVYKESGDEKGLTNINLIPASNAETVAVTVTEPLSLTVSRIVTTCFIIFSIVDVVRKKPRRYGWYIVLCIVLFWYSANGVRLIMLPIGSLIYWCIRKKVLAKKPL